MHTHTLTTGTCVTKLDKKLNSQMVAHLQISRQL